MGMSKRGVPRIIGTPSDNESEYIRYCKSCLGKSAWIKIKFIKDRCWGGKWRVGSLNNGELKKKTTAIYNLHTEYHQFLKPAYGEEILKNKIPNQPHLPIFKDLIVSFLLFIVIHLKVMLFIVQFIIYEAFTA